ncbi:MAG TPA: acyl carrier protein [Candidatus Dormibacteraeota bacterium]|jgi:acyl carrier protein|nr:acyl carrier protein [Candidatus Dormibacteraeota bacterium]
MEEIKEKVREFVIDAAQRKGMEVASDDESLTESGVIDSLAIFRLVSFLEDNFGIRIADEEIVNENFRSVNAIESFVSERLSKRGSPVHGGE